MGQIIGIDGSRAFIKKRTGIEECSYQMIKHLRTWLEQEEVVLYIRQNQEIDFDLPETWKVKKLWFPRFWTQFRLSLELMLHPVDMLFIPAHTVPIFHPKNTTVVIHGLEYEFYPQAYSFLERLYMRFVIKNSCKWAKKIIAVSENTKKDVINLYKVSQEKIKVVYEGYSGKMQTGIEQAEEERKSCISGKYIFFVGRIEERKNIRGIIEAFDILKQKYGVSHKLVLAGKSGYGYKEIKERIEKSDFKQDILEMGFITDDEKWDMLKCADVFVFPSFYEGFGLPILEAQNAFVPVVTSNISSIPEVAGEAVLYCDPNDHGTMAENIYILINNKTAREDVIKRGYENVKRFSWADCAKQLSYVIKEK